MNGDELDNKKIVKRKQRMTAMIKQESINIFWLHSDGKLLSEECFNEIL